MKEITQYQIVFNTGTPNVFNIVRIIPDLDMAVALLRGLRKDQPNIEFRLIRVVELEVS